jgi:hypothetical protein
MTRVRFPAEAGIFHSRSGPPSLSFNNYRHSPQSSAEIVIITIIIIPFVANRKLSILIYEGRQIQA